MHNDFREASNITRKHGPTARRSLQRNVGQAFLHARNQYSIGRTDVSRHLVRPEGTINLSFTNAYLVAGLLAALIAWKTRHTLLTIGTGLTILWALTAMRH